jgi:hypothetical protein
MTQNQLALKLGVSRERIRQYVAILQLDVVKDRKGQCQMSDEQVELVTKFRNRPRRDAWRMVNRIKRYWELTDERFEELVAQLKLTVVSDLDPPFVYLSTIDSNKLTRFLRHEQHKRWGWHKREFWRNEAQEALG